MNTKEHIKTLYIKYLNAYEKMPPSVQTFLNGTGVSQQTFDAEYGHFIEIEKSIWLDFFDDTLNRLHGEDIYFDYMVREKILAFYFTMIEVLKENRVFIKSSMLSKGFSGKILASFKDKFYSYISGLMQEGFSSDEVQERLFISERYPFLFWQQTQYLIHFWMKDTSEEFQKTDAAVEKAVNFSFDIIGRNVADSAIDFAKFFFQNKF